MPSEGVAAPVTSVPEDSTDPLAGSAEPDGPEAAPPARAQPFAVVQVRRIDVDLPQPHAVVVLREIDDPHRSLAIPVGLPEATALAHAWRGVATPRPLTHELFADVLVRLGAVIDAVRLVGRRAGVVLAEIELSSPRGRERVECRPTDALTLAIRQPVGAPMLVDARLFDTPGDVEPDPPAS